MNTASQCGFTPQFGGLERLWDEYADQGFVVLGFPCNQFGNQDPGSADEIGEFCQANYGVTFPMFDKVDVNGDDAHPLFQWLKSEKSGLVGEKIKWNFTKFLIGRDGRVIKRDRLDHQAREDQRPDRGGPDRPPAASRALRKALTPGSVGRGRPAGRRCRLRRTGPAGASAPDRGRHPRCAGSAR